MVYFTLTFSSFPKYKSSRIKFDEDKRKMGWFFDTIALSVTGTILGLAFGRESFDVIDFFILIFMELMWSIWYLPFAYFLEKPFIKEHNYHVKIDKLLYDIETEVRELKNELAEYYEKYDNIPEKLQNAEGLYHIWLLMKDYHYSLSEAIQEARQKNSIAERLQLEVTDEDLQLIDKQGKKWAFQETDELLKEDEI